MRFTNSPTCSHSTDAITTKFVEKRAPRAWVKWRASDTLGLVPVVHEFDTWPRQGTKACLRFTSSTEIEGTSGGGPHKGGNPKLLEKIIENENLVNLRG